ncbi:hypothetical protein V8F33_006328 [Rhypophila sp. PSN 637]
MVNVTSLLLSALLWAWGVFGESDQPSIELTDAFVVSTSLWSSVVVETSVWTSVVLETIMQTTVGTVPVIYTVTGDSTTTSTIGTPTTVGLSSEAPSMLSSGTPSTSSIQGQTTVASSSTQGSTPTSLNSPLSTTSPVGISSASSTSTSEPSSGTPSSSPVLSPSPSTQISTTPSTSLVESSLPASLPTPTAVPGSVTVPVPSGFTLSWTSFPTPFTLTSIPELPSAVPTWPAGTPSSSSTTSSSATPSATPSPSADASPRYIAPLHVCKLDNVEYSMDPYCDEEPQVLWLSDGTNFTLHCDRFELYNGTVLAMPANIADDVDCSGLGLVLDDICCFRRFNWVKTSEPTFNSPAERCNAVITPHSMFKAAARGSTTAADDPISQIASKLGGLPSFACEASQAMLSLAVSIFSMGMATDNFMSAADDVIELFITTVTRQSDALLSQLNTWIHDVDQTMLELYCIVDTADGHKSRIWRVIISVLRLIICGIALRFKFLIGAWGAVLEGMGQLSRTCNTNWKEPALRNPQDEEPEEEDEDGMTTRFWIEGSQLSSLAQLWTVEGTLGVPIGGVPDDNPQGPWEISAASWDGSVPPSLLSMTKMPGWDQFISATRNIPDPGLEPWDESLSATRASPGRDPRHLKFGRDGKMAVDHDSLDRNKTSEEDKHRGNELAGAADPPAKKTPHVPVRDSVDFHPPSDQLPFISRPKGKDEQYQFYSHHSSKGQGSWIFVVDSGFTTAQYEQPDQDLAGRTIRKWFVPQQYTLPKLPQNQPATPGNPASVAQPQIWPVPESIEDDCWGTDFMLQTGHGMMMTSIAAGNFYGVAPKANLYLIKAHSGFYKTDPATVPPGVTTGGIPPAKSVIVMAIRLGAYRTQYGGWETDQEWLYTWNEWRNKLDLLGVTFVFANSNEGFNPQTGGLKRLGYQENFAVSGWIGQDNPALLVGGVYPDGSPWEGTTPSDPARKYAQISIYSRAYAQSAYVSGGEFDSRRYELGIIFRNANKSRIDRKQAGLVAYFLAYHWPAGLNPFDPTDTSKTVGKRMKEYLISASYQRVPDNAITTYALRPGGDIDKAGFHSFPWPPPRWVNTVYIMAEGPQRCLAVGPLPAGRFGAASGGDYPDTCPVPAVVPRDDATWTGTALTAASTYSAPDLPTTLSWTITSERTTFVSVVTWVPSSTSISLSSTSISSSSTSTSLSSSISSTSSTAPLIISSRSYDLTSTTSTTVTLATATIVTNPDPTSIVCFGSDVFLDGQELDHDTAAITAREFCVGGEDGTYGGYYPNGVPDNLAEINPTTYLTLGYYPGQVPGDPGNFTGFVYEASIRRMTHNAGQVPGEWTIPKCQLYFKKIFETCNGGFYGGFAVDQNNVKWMLDGYHWYGDKPIAPDCWDKDVPEKACYKWQTY